MKTEEYLNKLKSGASIKFSDFIELIDSEYNFSNMLEGWKIYAKVTNLFDQKYYTGGRIAESMVAADRSFADDEIATASLVGGAPRAGWVGLRYEF